MRVAIHKKAYLYKRDVRVRWEDEAGRVRDASGTADTTLKQIWLNDPVRVCPGVARYQLGLPWDWLHSITLLTEDGEITL